MTRLKLDPIRTRNEWPICQI